jgi:heptose-I-phosphate ethanolaminephosphotransferase
MPKAFPQKHPILWAYLFFLYFSGVNQFLIYLSGMSGFRDLRQAIIVSILWLIPLIIWPTRAKLTCGLIGLILWIGSIVTLGYWLIYGQGFSQSVLFIIFESNAAESNEFIRSYLRWWHLPVFAIYSFIPYLMWKKITSFEVKRHQKTIFVPIILLILIWPIINISVVKGDSFERASEKFINKIEPATPWNLVLGYSKYLAQLNAMQENLATNRNAPLLEEFSEKNSDVAKTFVLVIGESTNSQRMGLYGYPRETTPKLKSLQDELFVFNDVIAPRPYTIEALQQILSFDDEQSMSGKGVADFFMQPTLLNMMKQAGYEITWITNQQTQTKRNTMLTTLSQLADKQIYLNNNKDQNAHQHDGVVLAPFAQALSSPAAKKFIVVHLLGTHRKYNYRYPASFDNFTTREGAHSWITDGVLDDYNSYDNAVLYNDYVVHKLISNLSKQESQKLLVYFSDHGEEVYDSPNNLFSGRNESKPTAAMYTIPFIAWASPEYLAKNSTQQWKNYLDRPYANYDFIYTWADMVGIDFKGNDHSRSIISAQFIERPRWIGSPKNKATLQPFADIKPN